MIKIYDVEILISPDDLETGWNNPWLMGFGTAVVWDEELNLYRFYGPSDRERLINDLKNSIVVSFNGIKFDNHVILPPDQLQDMWTDYDILLEVIKSKFGLPDVQSAEKKLGQREVHDGSISLDGLAEGTLGLHKTGHGAHAPKLIQKQQWAAVYAYNLNDVRLTRMLLAFIRKYGYLIDRKGNKINLSFKETQK